MITPVTDEDVARAAALQLDGLQFVRAYLALATGKEAQMRQAAKELAVWLRASRWHEELLPASVFDFLIEVGARITLAANSSPMCCMGRLYRLLEAHLRTIAEEETRRRKDLTNGGDCRGDDSHEHC